MDEQYNARYFLETIPRAQGMHRRARSYTDASLYSFPPLYPCYNNNNNNNISPTYDNDASNLLRSMALCCYHHHHGLLPAPKIKKSWVWKIVKYILFISFFVFFGKYVLAAIGFALVMSLRIIYAVGQIY